MKKDNCNSCSAKDTGCRHPVKNTPTTPCPCAGCKTNEICRDTCEHFLQYIDHV